MAQNDSGGLNHGTPRQLPPKYPRPIRDDDRKQKEEFGAAVQHRNGMKSSPENQLHRPLHSRFRESNWGYNGPVMQAGLLGRSPRSCGTGVFLPRMTEFWPITEPDGKTKKLETKKKGEDKWCSPEIFLPKEWTY